MVKGFFPRRDPHLTPVARLGSGQSNWREIPVSRVIEAKVKNICKEEKKRKKTSDLHSVASPGRERKEERCRKESNVLN